MADVKDVKVIEGADAAADQAVEMIAHLRGKVARLEKEKQEAYENGVAHFMLIMTSLELPNNPPRVVFETWDILQKILTKAVLTETKLSAATVAAATLRVGMDITGEIDREHAKGLVERSSKAFPQFKDELEAVVKEPTKH